MDAPRQIRPSGYGFSYTKEEAEAIRKSLVPAGLQTYDADWKGLLFAITDIACTAQIHVASGQPLYATKAAKQARKLAKEMAAVATRYNDLDVDFQALVASQLDLVCEPEEKPRLPSDPPLLPGALPTLKTNLYGSLLPAERPTLKRLLSGARLTLLLHTVASCLELVATQLDTAGKVLPPSPLPTRLDGLSEEDNHRVRKAITKAARAKRRPFGGRFPSTGAPKEEVVRWVVLHLWALYQDVTDELPTVYPSNHASDGYGGRFYAFVKAVLAPLKLVARKSLPNAIYAAYEEHRQGRLSRT